MADLVVTGAAGFIGGHVVESLVAQGRTVVAVDRAETPAYLGRLPGVEVITAELTEHDDRVVTALQEAGAVVHLAACPGVRDTTADIGLRRERDNVRATAAVITATPLGTPLVVASSSSVYGGSLWQRPSHEDDLLNPRGGYAASKVATERLCEQRLDGGGLVTIARPFTVAGERQRPDMALAQWIDAARFGRALRILGSPSRSRDITDVRDVARALCALADAAWCGPVNIGTGVAHTLAELADAVCAAVGREVPRVVVEAARYEARDTLADTARLRHIVGFTPTTDLPALVARQVAATSIEVPDEVLAGASP